MVRNKFAEQMALLLSSVRVMGVNLEEALDKVIANLENKDKSIGQKSRET